jgi:hypothetical protein
MGGELMIEVHEHALWIYRVVVGDVVAGAAVPDDADVRRGAVAFGAVRGTFRHPKLPVMEHRGDEEIRRSPLEAHVRLQEPRALHVAVAPVRALDVGLGEGCATVGWVGDRVRHRVALGAEGRVPIAAHRSVLLVGAWERSAEGSYAYVGGAQEGQV